ELAGRAWYETSALQTERKRNALHIFNPYHLAQVALKKLQPWDVQPVHICDLTDLLKPYGFLGGGLAGVAANGIVGASFDAATNRLYAYANWDKDLNSRIFVFNLKSGS